MWPRSLPDHLATVERVLAFVIGSIVLVIAVAIRRLVPDSAERLFEDIAQRARAGQR